MNIQYHFVHISESEKQTLKDYCNKRMYNLLKLIGGFDEDDRFLKVDLEHREKHNEYELKSTLEVHGQVFHHQEVSHSYTEVIDKTEDNLMRQIRKHIDKSKSVSSQDRAQLEELQEEGVDDNYDNI